MVYIQRLVKASHATSLPCLVYGRPPRRDVPHLPRSPVPTTIADDAGLSLFLRVQVPKYLSTAGTKGGRGCCDTSVGSRTAVYAAISVLMIRRDAPARCEVIIEMASSCILARSRLIARVISSIHDQELRAFGVNSAQFSLLLIMYKMGSATRAEIGRYYHQDRSTLTRTLKVMVGEGWIEDDDAGATGRSRPMRVTANGADLLLRAKPAWEEGQRAASAILGDDGTSVVREVGNRILMAKKR